MIEVSRLDTLSNSAYAPKGIARMLLIPQCKNDVLNRRRG
jgi:hypothetical protein